MGWKQTSEGNMSPRDAEVALLLLLSLEPNSEMQNLLGTAAINNQCIIFLATTLRPFDNIFSSKRGAHGLLHHPDTRSH